MTISSRLSHPVIDCHVHVFEPVHFPYADGVWLAVRPRAGAHRLRGLAGPVRAMFPDPAARQAVLYDTPRRLFAFD